jgi:gas vesicle protein
MARFKLNFTIKNLSIVFGFIFIRCLYCKKKEVQSKIQVHRRICMARNVSGKKCFAWGALIGSLVGGVTALLLAPKSGERLRKDIVRKYQSATEKTCEIIDDMCEQTCDLVEKAKEVACNAKEAATKLYRSGKERLREED